MRAKFKSISDETGATYTPKGDVNQIPMMINGIYSMNVVGDLSAFVGAGLGYTRVTMSLDTVDGADAGYKDTTKYSFTYQGKAGLKYNVTQNWNTQLAYTYAVIDGGKNKYDDGTGATKIKSFETSLVTLSVGYEF